MSKSAREYLKQQLDKAFSGSKVNIDPLPSAIDIDPEHEDTANPIAEWVVPKSNCIEIAKQLTDDEKIDELLNVILEKFKDYRTNGYIENSVVKKLVTKLLDSRETRRNELDAEEYELASSTNELIGLLVTLSKTQPV